MATKKTDIETKAETNQGTKVDYWDELVPVHLIQPEGETQNAKTVTHNGKNYQIQYGKEVMVPRKIAEILKQSAENKAIADAELARMAGYHELGSI